VFPNPGGAPRDGTRLTHNFQERLARKGLRRMTFHELRHGCATLMLAQGAELRTISDVLGHSTITITADLYAHVAPRLKRAVADRMQAALG
jgi:integrase